MTNGSGRRRWSMLSCMISFSLSWVLFTAFGWLIGSFVLLIPLCLPLGNYLIEKNEVSSQNLLVMSGVTHKRIYVLKPFNFIKVWTNPTFTTLTSKSIILRIKNYRRSCNKNTCDFWWLSAIFQLARLICIWNFLWDRPFSPCFLTSLVIFLTIEFSIIFPMTSPFGNYRLVLTISIH